MMTPQQKGLGCGEIGNRKCGGGEMKSLYGTVVVIPAQVCTLIAQEFTPWQEFKFWLRDTMPLVGLAFLWGLYAAFMVFLFRV